MDPAKPNHAPLKSVLFHLLTHRRKHVIPIFREVYSDIFGLMDNDLARAIKSDFGSHNDAAGFGLLYQALLGRDPTDSPLRNQVPKLILKCVMF
jgi:hydroperoxide dehydratase